jgi:hypothetical protein
MYQCLPLHQPLIYPPGTPKLKPRQPPHTPLLVTRPRMPPLRIPRPSLPACKVAVWVQGVEDEGLMREQRAPDVLQIHAAYLRGIPLTFR